MEGECGGGDFGYQAGGFESLGGVDNSSGGFECGMGYTAGVPEVLQGGEGGGFVGSEDFNPNPVEFPDFDNGEGNLDVMEMQTKMMKKGLKEQQKQMKQFEKQQQKMAKERQEQLKKEKESAEKKKKQEEEKRKKAKAKPKDDDSDSDDNVVYYNKNWKSPAQRQREANQRAMQQRQMQNQAFMQSQHQFAMQQQALQQQQAMLWNQMNFGGGFY